MSDTAIAGSLPKPAWLAETEKRWPHWKPAAEARCLRANTTRRTKFTLSGPMTIGRSAGFVPRQRAIAHAHRGPAPVLRAAA